MNTRNGTKKASSANPSAKPAPKPSAKATSKKGAPASRARHSEATPAPAAAAASTSTSTSTAASEGATHGRKRKQNEPAVDTAAAETPSLDAAALARFQAWEATQKLTSQAAKQKAAKALKDKAIQDLNAKLLAAEETHQDTDSDHDASEDEAQPKKKTRLDPVLDEDELAALDDITGSGGNEEEDGPGPAVEDEEEEDGYGAGIFEEDIISVSPAKKVSSKEPSMETGDDDDDDEDGDEFASNGITIINAGLKPPSFSRSSKAPSPAPSSKGNNKVTRADFESESVRALADTAKSMVRMNILFGNWDTTHGGKSASQRWGTDILQSVVKEEPSMRKALTHAFQDEASKENLLTYILYGKGALLNTFISKARLIVATNYGLAGSKEFIAARVAWLLKKTQFTYGGITPDAHTVEKTKIWGNPMIKELLQLVLFGQGGKADARTVQEVRKNQAIPISAIILSVTAIEHAIGEYRDGSCRQYPFKELGVRKRYTYHERNWNTLLKLSEKWSTFYLQGVFQAIAATIGLDDLVDGENGGEDVEGITAMDLDNIADMNITPF